MVTARDQLFPQFAVVIEFSVVCNNQVSIAGLHRLRASIGKIDDCETPVRQSDTLVAIYPEAVPVGPTRGHRFADVDQFSDINGSRVLLIAKDSSDTTH